MSALSTELQMKFAELEKTILEAHPRLPILLKEIHTQLKADPTTVTLLNEEEIRILFTGLQRQVKVSLTEAATPKKKSLKSVGVADL